MQWRRENSLSLCRRRASNLGHSVRGLVNMLTELSRLKNNTYLSCIQTLSLTAAGPTAKQLTVSLICERTSVKWLTTGYTNGVWFFVCGGVVPTPRSPSLKSVPTPIWPPSKIIVDSYLYTPLPWNLHASSVNDTCSRGFTSGYFTVCRTYMTLHYSLRGLTETDIVAWPDRGGKSVDGRGRKGRKLRTRTSLAAEC
jgi:hypothetical protein